MHVIVIFKVIQYSSTSKLITLRKSKRKITNFFFFGHVKHKIYKKMMKYLYVGRNQYIESLLILFIVMMAVNSPSSQISFCHKHRTLFISSIISYFHLTPPSKRASPISILVYTNLQEILQ